jgi:sugar transferase (PEP-CTERM/EpsH1 system associated)
LSRPLRILFVAPYVPSPLRIRPYAFIRELAARGHQVTLVCLVQPPSEEQYLSDVTRYCQAVHPVHLSRLGSYGRCLASLPTATPLSVAYCRSGAARDTVRRLLAGGEFDLLHTEFLRATPLTQGLNTVPRVYDAVDSLALTYRRSISAPGVSPVRRLVSGFEWLKVRRYEPQMLRQFDSVLVSSPADRAALDRRPDNGIAVIPNGVDLDFFAQYDGPRDPDTVAFLGKMSYYVNVASIGWYCNEVLPLVRRLRPGVRLAIVGRDPVARVRALAKDNSIQITGSVPDVRPYLSRAAVCVCPMVTGAGIQNKMLEAMAVGTPVVSTSIACQALSVEPGRELLVADDPNEFAHHVHRLLEDPGLARRLAANARRYVEQHHNWREIVATLEELYHAVLSGDSSRLADRTRAQSTIGPCIKRISEALFAAVLLVITSPLLGLIAIAVAVDSRGPVLFRHRRIGKGGKPFDILKFRSMVAGGDDTQYLEYLHQLTENDRRGEQRLAYRNMVDDPRVTRVGKILRRYYLDELPQLWNVLKGDMSLVGPRPHVQFEVDHYRPDQTQRLMARPGCTGLWQIAGKADCTFDELIAMDLDYIKRWSLMLDLEILFRTAMLILRGGEHTWARKSKRVPTHSGQAAGE